jgi:hypothetical protein
MRLGALLNDAQNIGMDPTSVAGGEKAAGNWLDKAGFCGPGSVALDGFFVVFRMPCGGSSGLPNEAARAVAAALATPVAAVAASHLRRETDSIIHLSHDDMITLVLQPT